MWEAGQQLDMRTLSIDYVAYIENVHSKHLYVIFKEGCSQILVQYILIYDNSERNF